MNSSHRISKSNFPVEGSLDRAPAKFQQKKFFLIVTEGKNTEPSYFEHLKNMCPNVFLKVEGMGMGTSNLVNSVKSIKCEEEKKARINFDEVWVVFDKDTFSDFDEAIKLAERKKYKVAYSNQAFEYWIILHFYDHQGGSMDRKRYVKKINQGLENFKLKYDKRSKKIDDKIFELLMAKDKQTNKYRYRLAYDRAEKIIREKNNNNIPPSKMESITLVGRLLKSILADNWPT